MAGISAPLFNFEGSSHLPLSDSHLRADPAQGYFTLSGPSVKAEPDHLPVRGDLAHIKLAGRYFVPHYAVPMPHAVATGGAVLRKAGKPASEPLCELAEGDIFDVLDIAGGWAWGQYGEDGPVGYILLEQLVRTAA